MEFEVISQTNSKIRYSQVYSLHLCGLEPVVIEVECTISSGLPSFCIVGLADTAIMEAKERIRSAILNCGFQFPLGRITINLAPADQKKRGPGLDLAMVCALLLADNQIDESNAQRIYLGELALSGQIRSVDQLFAMLLSARNLSQEFEFVLPEEDSEIASLVPQIKFTKISHLNDLRSQLGDWTINSSAQFEEMEESSFGIFNQIHGQPKAIRAIELAASARLNLLMSGPPGSGKSMLSQALYELLPRLESKQALEVSQIYSIDLDRSRSLLSSKPPFRSPHHSSSTLSFVGGGSQLRPGEISKAHAGVLVLDELLEFPRASLENLRQPMSEGVIQISRVQGSVTYPAHFQCIATTNPCPCGFFTDPVKSCTCSELAIRKYRSKLSAPMLDRFHLQIVVARPNLTSLQRQEENCLVLSRDKVLQCHLRQRSRNPNRVLNRELSLSQMKNLNLVQEAFENEVVQRISKLHLSLRSLTNIYQLAITIMDFDQANQLSMDHIEEALLLRFHPCEEWNL